MKVLLVRFSAIGDCILAAHAATALRLADPEGLLVWAIESRCSPVVDRERLVDEVHEFPRDIWQRRRWSPVTWWETVRAHASLRKYRFDLGIDLQGHSKTALCLRLSGARRRISANATDVLARVVNPVVTGDRDSMHVVEWQRRVLAEVGDYPAVDRPIMPTLHAERASVKAMLDTGRPLATISTGAGAINKRWPIERWLQVGDALTARGMAVAYLGGAGDPKPGRDLDLVGKLPLAESMAAVAESALHLCADTGSGHMAAAYGVPVVSIFGPMPPVRFRPWTPDGEVLHKGADPAAVTVEEVLAASDRLLAKGGRP